VIYLDANVVIAAVSNVLEEARTERVERLMRRTKEPFYLSTLADYEARKSLLTGGGGDEHLSRLDTLIAGKLHLNAAWDVAVLQALKLARQFKQRLAVNSADTLHVGWALAIGADVFASFDRLKGPRALALAVGLTVWPKAEAADYQAMSRLKRAPR
jgi:predicted nucleic acid-binding protein